MRLDVVCSVDGCDGRRIGSRDRRHPRTGAMELSVFSQRLLCVVRRVGLRSGHVRLASVKHRISRRVRHSSNCQVSSYSLACLFDFHHRFCVLLLLRVYSAHLEQQKKTILPRRRFPRPARRFVVALRRPASLLFETSEIPRNADRLAHETRIAGAHGAVHEAHVRPLLRR